MTDAFDVQAAYGYYVRFILNEERFGVLNVLGLPVVGSVHSRDWEAFGALLTRDAARGGYGADLTRHEVKSAVEGRRFEYQYHRRGGVEKLDDDMAVDHVFVSYSRDYRSVAVRLVPGAALADIFESWRAGLEAAYSGENRKLRFRPGIPHGTVVRSGRLLMLIRGGRLTEPEDGGVAG